MANTCLLVVGRLVLATVEMLQSFVSASAYVATSAAVTELSPHTFGFQVTVKSRFL